MSVKRGGPRKDIFFPIESVTFRKRELDQVLEVLVLNLRSCMTNFGPSASFKLDLDIQVARRTLKKQEAPCPKLKPRTPTHPQTGTSAGKRSPSRKAKIP